MSEHPEDGALINIWPERTDLSSVARGRIVFGHVYLKLVGPSYPERSWRRVYVTWWPSGKGLRTWGAGPWVVKESYRSAYRAYKNDEIDEIGARTRLGLAGQLPGQNGVPYPPRPHQRPYDDSLPREEWTWLGIPEKLFVPGVTERAPYGLDLFAIEAWWEAFQRAPEGVWRTLDRNCSDVVAKALEVGGAGAFARKPRAALFKPSVVKRWGQEIAAACARRNAVVADLTKSGSTRRLAKPARDRVMTGVEWRARCREGRPSEGREVAALLDQYHALRGDDRVLPADKIALLELVLNRLHEELFHPGSPERPRPRYELAFDVSLQCVEATRHWGTVGTASAAANA